MRLIWSPISLTIHDRYIAPQSKTKRVKTTTTNKQQILRETNTLIYIATVNEWLDKVLWCHRFFLFVRVHQTHTNTWKDREIEREKREILSQAQMQWAYVMFDLITFGAISNCLVALLITKCCAFREMFYCFRLRCARSVRSNHDQFERALLSLVWFGLVRLWFGSSLMFVSRSVVILRHWANIFWYVGGVLSVYLLKSNGETHVILTSCEWTKKNLLPIGFRCMLTAQVF